MSKYHALPNEMPLSSEHQVYLGNSVQQHHVRKILLACACVVFVFVMRSGYLQLIAGAEYRNLAEGNRIRTVPIESKRGLIVDHNGVILAENVPTFFLSLVPEFMPHEQAQRDALIVAVADATHIPPQDIEDELLTAGRDVSEPVIVRQELTKDVALKAMIALKDYRAVSITSASKRSYPLSPELPSLSHILGYTSKITKEQIGDLLKQGYIRSDVLGKIGLEYQYESQLRGVYGKKSAEVDVRGNVERIIFTQAKKDGATLRLSLDARLQAVAEKAMREVFAKTGTNRGVVVALDPRNGHIKALVSLPAYDNNLFSTGIPRAEYQKLITDAAQPLYNRAVSGEYPSGSTLKIVYAAAALAEGVITDATTVNSTGGIAIGAWFFPDWKPGGHGVVNVRKAIAWSVNTFFYMIAGGLDSFQGLGITKMGEWTRKFGLDAKLGVDLPGERPGFYPTPEWKQKDRNEPWYIGDTYHAGIGQGMVLVTPLQVAAYTSVIANGGTLYAPTLAERFEIEGDAPQSVPPHVVRSNIASDDVLAIVRKGMREAVQYGSARFLNDLPIAVAGKTGTAQFQTNKHPHAWFSGFAPYEQPELVVTVLVEEGIEGSTNAVPIAKKVFAAWEETR